MSEDNMYQRIAQFINKLLTVNDTEAQCMSSTTAIDAELSKTVETNKELKDILKIVSAFLRDSSSSNKDDLDKQLVQIGKLLGPVSSNNSLISDKLLCESVVECLARIATLECRSEHQSRASTWAKSRLRHMLHDDSKSKSCFAIKVCGFEEVVYNNTAAEMIASYLKEKLTKSEWNDDFCQLLVDLDIGNLLFTPQASSVIKAVLHHDSLPNSIKHQISSSINDQDSVDLSIWLEDLDKFETDVVNLMEVLLKTPDMTRKNRLQLIRESQITKACVSHQVLKNAAVIILDSFKEQSEYCPLLVTVANDIVNDIREY
ncbi:uncharacterized protein [Antedon mediterranea]|uniref:uncharacterized protein n=1 Tax=Antedon mediterranea TaxID=105859 RepID=UPI003AF549F1